MNLTNSEEPRKTKAIARKCVTDINISLFIKAGLGNDTIDNGSGFDVLQLDCYSSSNAVTSFLLDSNSDRYSDGYSTAKFDNIKSLNVIGSNYSDMLVALTGNNNIPSMNPMPMNQIDGGESKDNALQI